MSNMIITISRSYGSGGRVIGRMLSENLKIPYYDRNLIYLASNRTGIDLKYFAKYDEDMKRKIFDDIIPSERNKYVSKDEIFMRQAEVIKDVAPMYQTDALVKKVNTDRYDDRLVVETNLIESYDQLFDFAAKHLPDKF